jgi:hypothetical protein
LLNQEWETKTKMKKSFEQIKSEYIELINRVFEIEKKNFGNFTFAEASELIRIRARLEHEIADKIRLLNDIQNLSQIEVQQ